MIRLSISPEDQKIIQRERYYHPQPYIMVRMHVLALHAAGETAPRIAELLRKNIKTVRACLHAYEKGGLAEVYKYEKHKHESELEEFGTLIEEELTKNPPASAAQAGAKIAELTGIKRSPTQVREFLKKKKFTV